MTPFVDLFDMTFFGDLPKPLMVVCAGFVGAVMASFAGVVAERLPHQLGITAYLPEEGAEAAMEQPAPALTIASPPSRCDGCSVRLDPLSLVPVFGWLLRQGRCRHCGHRVSGVYPLVEACCALVSAAVVGWFGLTGTAIGLLVLLWAGLALAWTDILHHVLPEAVTLPLFWAGLLLSPLAPDVYARALGAFAAFTATWASLRVISALRREDVMSGGDVAVAAVAGAWLGIEWVPTFLEVAVVVFIILALPARIRGRVMVPFGPSLCGALFVVAVVVAWTGAGV